MTGSISNESEWVDPIVYNKTELNSRSVMTELNSRIVTSKKDKHMHESMEQIS